MSDGPESAVTTTELPAKRGGKPMDRVEFKSLIAGVIGSCVTFAEELSTQRAKATNFYNAEPFGNEEEGRSQIVLSEVRDAVLGVLPSLIRVLLGADYPVEFVPRRADVKAAEQAAQATEYIRYVFLEDNPGFMNTVSVLKDGLVRRLGIFKWGWDESKTVRAYRLEGVTEAELEEMAGDESVELTRIEKNETPGLFDIEVTHTEEDGRGRVWAIPPEEFLMNREARDVETALFVGHRTEKTRGELIAMGISEKDLDEFASGDASGDRSLRGGPEDVARRGNTGALSDPELGKANNKISYVEGYARIDYDGDKIAELRKVCTIGPGYHPVVNIPWNRAPFSVFTPDPEPHTLIGHSWEDRLDDIQKVKSAVLRGTLDSLSASIFPRMTYEQGYASVADMLNTAIGAPIRITKPGAVQSFSHPFVGQAALPVLEFFNDVTERRIGRNNGAGGLDADALQSTDKAGVQAAISGSQEQAEMLARFFAESCFKPLFKGLLELFVEHQPKARTVRLRGKWVDVKPDAWDAGMDVQVNVALGAGFTERKIATLVAILAQQKEIYATYGPENPLVTVAMIRNTMAKIADLQGVKDIDNYFLPVGADWKPEPTPPAPTPEEVLAKAQVDTEQLKVTGNLAMKKDELLLEEKKLDLDHAYRMEQLAAEIEMKKYVADAQYGATMDAAQLDADIKTETKSLELALHAHDQVHTHEMDNRAADVADKEAEAAATAAAAPAPTGAA